jgi:predicted nucleic acid-binding protein
VTHIELLQGARDRAELRQIKGFLSDLGFVMVPLSENIGHRASIYIEEYGLKTAMSLADALIAATAVEHNQTLCTGNQKHYKAVQDLDLKTFRS